MTDNPTISIIMASYNHADFIGRAIESVLQQTYDSWELLIADDASTDNTRKVLDAYKDDPRIKIFPFEINRQHHMRNFASEHARGKFLAFLNSDDTFAPEKLQKQIKVLTLNEDVLAVFTQVSIIDENNERLTEHSLEKTFCVCNQTRHEWLRHFLISGNCLCISSAVIRRECFESVGRFNPLLIQVSDLDLWVKTCLQGSICIIPEKLTSMRILKQGKNLSTASEAVSSRIVLENLHIYKHYFSPAAIEQALNIFPDLNGLLPEDTPAWRHFFLCSKLVASPHRSMRFAGLTQLHELLANPETKISLQRQHPRLLRNLFLCEGSSSLEGKPARCQWKVSFIEKDDKQNHAYCYHTAAIKKGTICHSVPNPNIPSALSVTIAGKRFPFRCKRFCLYDQLTGKCIFDSTNTQSNTKKSPGCLNYIFSNPRYDTPVIDFSKYSSKWVDLEIDCIPMPFSSLVNSMRRIFAFMRRKS